MLQALGLNFTAVSLSEANPDYRCVIETNYPNQVEKVFSDVKDQILFHKKKHGSDGEVDLGVTGSPCNPFSTQRTKRFSDGDVVSHHQFETTMTSIIEFYEHVEPKLGITEQVAGFDKPLSTTQSETPLQMRLGLIFV